MPSQRTVAEIEADLLLARTAINNLAVSKIGAATVNSRNVVRPFEGLEFWGQREKDLKAELQRAEAIAAGQTPGLIIRYGVPTG